MRQSCFWFVAFLCVKNVPGKDREDWEWNYFDGKFFVPFYDIDKTEQMF